MVSCTILLLRSTYILKYIHIITYQTSIITIIITIVIASSFASSSPRLYLISRHIHPSMIRWHLLLTLLLIGSINLLDASRLTSATRSLSTSEQPFIRSITPTSLSPSSSSSSLTWITISGDGFGTTSKQLYQIIMQQIHEDYQSTSTSSTSSSSSSSSLTSSSSSLSSIPSALISPLLYHCNPIEWVSPISARCRPPSTLPAGLRYTFQMNVSHMLSPRSDGIDAVLQVDCYEKGSVCERCHRSRDSIDREMTRIESGRRLASGNTTDENIDDSSSSSLGLSRTTILSLLIIGGISLLLFLLICILMCLRSIRSWRRGRNNSRKVGEQHHPPPHPHGILLILGSIRGRTIIRTTGSRILRA